ncbi:MAG: hypothetical protein EOM80_16320 [Erysipelotrichia bacterium]|nr:hypothetical protein [Erysipelotrichia bacterium]
MKIISGNREFRPSAADILAMATNQNFVDLNTFRQTVASLEREKEFWRNLAIENEYKLMQLQNQSYPQP